MRSIALLSALALALVLAVAACGGDDDENGDEAAAPAVTTTEEEETTTAEEAEAMNIVETAIAAGDFTTLVDLVQQADLVDALSGPGPLTVFAPTDEAFAAVPQETLDALAEDPEALQNVLLYHVVEGEVTSDQVEDGATAATLAGPELEFSVNGGVMVNDATVVSPDVMASNGVIHVIDAVLLPPS